MWWEEEDEVRVGDWLLCNAKEEEEKESGEREESCVVAECIDCKWGLKETGKRSGGVGVSEGLRMKSWNYVLQGSDRCGKVECKG